ncbi:Saccharopine dehydrogenase, NADP-dependent [Virgibacillus subterraneus]|uniref:Saccharopine dehydrogenase, NADP-dependent n=1 Tax=Virgibacillus subterraneus TaxID=621109 RepID=A0A1H9APS7_9BACI|nr:saccharopine dehydrogenase C-terminal domain-containing protein [Virgibacillus subterraneus]SEP78764.1 Saccharopine dehydrogenase, NADP-dependent [Virgibacillus subterraneus]
MKVVVFGGSGLQGRAAMYDLCTSPTVTKIICADVNFTGLDSFSNYLNMNKISKKTIDANNIQSLVDILEGADIAIDLLPKQFNSIVAKAAIEAKVHLVNCSYAQGLHDTVHEHAKEQEITIMPEAGLDPGIDLILCGYAASQLDEVHELYSYCGGVPSPEAANNALNYKISWNLDSTLMAYKRPATLLKNGEIIEIPAEEQHNKEWLKTISFPGFGTLEAIPNGNAIKFARLLGIDKSVVNTERRTLRWIGHGEFWSKMSALGFLSKEPVEGLPIELTPHQFLRAHLEPQLQYEADEKDLVLMRNIVKGIKDEQIVELTYDLVDKRDLETGLFAMNRTVGFTASIVAQMIVKEQITKPGLLSPIKDIPFEIFFKEINHRGIIIQESKQLVKTNH